MKPQEHFRKLKPFIDPKKNYILKVVVHFFTDNRNKILFTDYLFSFEREEGVEVANGRFMDKEKIKIESGLMTKGELAFLKRTAGLLGKKTPSVMIIV